MRRKIAAICVGLMAALLPATGALASEIPPPIEIKKCPAGYFGVTVTNYNATTGYTEVWACVPNP